MKPKYLTVQDHPQMGLNNTVCENPVAYCISKRVYLSVDDVTAKKCTNKPTVDLIGAFRCNWLRTLEGETNGSKKENQDARR